MSVYELEDIELREVSAVDTPANQHAAVVLFKRSGYTANVNPLDGEETAKGDGSVTVEELTKQLEALQAQVTDLTKRAEDAETAAATLSKSAEDAGLDVQDGKIVKRAEPEYVEIEGERVEKALVPAPILKAIEKQAAEIAKMQAKALEVDLAKRGATELPNLAGTDIAKGRLLAAVGEDADMLKALKAADAAMATQYTEKGHSHIEDEASAAYKLEQLAKAYEAAHNVTYHTAYAEVTKSGTGADLLVQMRQEAN